MLGKSLKTAVQPLLLLLIFALGAAAQTIPAGTRLTVRMGSEISSATAKAGDRFDASLARPLVVERQDSGSHRHPGSGQSDFRKIQRTSPRPGRSHSPLDLGPGQWTHAAHRHSASLRKRQRSH